MFIDYPNPSLEESLKLYRLKENIPKDDACYYCAKCADFSDVIKSLEFQRPSPILIFSLQRFKDNRKISTEVEFPIKGFCVDEFLIEKPKSPLIYDLYAVINHYGSLNGGHYTAHCYNSKKGKWYNCNDSYVEEVNEEKIG